MTATSGYIEAYAGNDIQVELTSTMLAGTNVDLTASAGNLTVTGHSSVTATSGYIDA